MKEPNFPVEVTGREVDIMPKKKTKKSAAKRFKRTANGKVKRGNVGRRHLAGSKNRNRKRSLRKSSLVSPHFEKQISNILA